jgi:peptidoglycan/LPS O-acetylase OafA/YrhL
MTASMRAPWRPWLWGGVALLLLIPGAAMLAGGDIDWGAEDFAFAALLLGGAAALFELAARLSRRPRDRALAAVALLALVLAIWAEAAVGIL